MFTCMRRRCLRWRLPAVVCLLLTLCFWIYLSPVKFTRVKQAISLGVSDRQYVNMRQQFSEDNSRYITHNHSTYSDGREEGVHHIDAKVQLVQNNGSNVLILPITQSNMQSSQSESRQVFSEQLLNVSDNGDSRTDNHLSMEESGLSLVYKNKWVGFRDIDGHYCPQALYSKTDNTLFQPRVEIISNNKFIADSKNCTSFRRDYGFNRYPAVSEEERHFPIAFIILFHSSLDQVMFLLRAIYRPHNVYCLSVDKNRGNQFLTAVMAVTQCLPNVFVASKLEYIVYAGFSRLMADIDCMEDLLKRPEPWKYVINMPGQQFPLRTNLELVRILTLFNGSNNIECTEEKLSSVKNRHLFKHIYAVNNKTGKLSPVRTAERNPAPPHQLQIVKGSTYGTFSRAFVSFALYHPIAKDFLEWNKNVLSPDEYFWTTLQHTLEVQVPGGVKEHQIQVPYITSFSVWKGSNYACAVKYVHKICIFSPEDLPNIVKQNSLFANKFYISIHPAALHCLDEWLVNRTFAGTVTDLRLYTGSSQVKGYPKCSG